MSSPGQMCGEAGGAEGCLPLCQLRNPFGKVLGRLNLKAEQDLCRGRPVLCHVATLSQMNAGHRDAERQDRRSHGGPWERENEKRGAIGGVPKTREGLAFSHRPPPSASQLNWRNGSNLPRKTRVLPIPASLWRKDLGNEKAYPGTVGQARMVMEMKQGEKR
jgi:hypothetical protein